MEQVISSKIVEDILAIRCPITTEFQKCSFITPEGKFIKIFEHYEIYKFLVVEQLVQCIPDAEALLNDLGYIRYSWIGYVTLPTKPLTSKQYKALELALTNISKDRDKISIQLVNEPKFYVDYDLNDIPHIISRIKEYYDKGFSLNL